MQNDAIVRLLQVGGESDQVAALTRGTNVQFVFAGTDWEFNVRVDDGSIFTTLGSRAGACYTLSAPDSLWEELLSETPVPGCHSLVTLVRSGGIVLTGSTLEYERTVHIARAIVDGARPSRPQLPLGKPLTAVGGYHRVTTSLGTCDVYVERAGAGTPMLAFATAGSDIAQWHGILTHTDFTDHYELITVDLPWHGKSSPAWGADVGSYELTPETYTEFIVACADILQLDRPVLIGVSMGGGAVVHAVATHPERFIGAVSCQAGPSVTARANAHLRGTQVNSATFIPEWTYGLMNPASPHEFKQRVWWGYSSGGFGLYAADIESYLQWNVATIADRFTEHTPHIAVLSGAYDTSVPTARSRELATLIPNSSFAEMPELGHFPHAENPARFVQYLLPAIERVLTA